MGMDSASLYRDEILDHYQNPRNFGKLQNATHHAHQTNPLCGDDIAMDVKINGGEITEIAFDGKGCAVCLAGASMLTESVLGKTKEELTKLTEQDMLNLLGIELSETRKKCAMLPLAVLKECMV
jgi:nitrogen fixation protein NifU and related proteins